MVLRVASQEQALRRIGGLSVLERQLWTSARAGFRRVRVCGMGTTCPAQLRLPVDLEISWEASEIGASTGTDPCLTVSGIHFIRPRALAAIAGQLHRPMAWEDASGKMVVEFTSDQGISEAARRRHRLESGDVFFLQETVDSGKTVAWLLAEGGKPEDGFMARHFDRKLSLAFSKILLDTPVSPNMMTVASALLGLMGAALFIEPSHSFRLCGALIVWLHSVLDGCDGELARLRFQESRFGRAMDFWGDNLVHVALFGVMSWGFARADRSFVPLIAGSIAIVGTVGSAILAYRQKGASMAPIKAEAESGLNGMLAGLKRILEARDFIYLLVFLAFIDRLYEFMWASGVGAMLFFFMMIYLHVGGHTYGSQGIQYRPHSAR